MVVHNSPAQAVLESGHLLPDRAAQQRQRAAVAVAVPQNGERFIQEFEANIQAQLNNLPGIMLVNRECAILRIIASAFVLILGGWIPLLCLAMCSQFVLLLVMAKIDQGWLAVFLVLDTAVALKMIYAATFSFWCDQIYGTKEVCLRRLVYENRYAKQAIGVSWLQSQLLACATVCKLYEWIWPFLCFECLAFCIFAALLDIHRQRNEFWQQFPYITVRDAAIKHIADAALEDDDNDSDTEAELV